ncbi:MAG: hypothetical protein ACTSRS_20335, partial [Candidatus Helarchaeota archaeon]
MRQIWILCILIIPTVFISSLIPVSNSVYSNYEYIYYSETRSIAHLLSTQKDNGGFFPPDMKMGSNNTYVFIHSYIFDTLLDTQAASFIISQNIISSAQNYLLRVKYVDCWNFSIGIPPDTDDSAIAAIAMHRSGISKEILNITFKKLNSTITDEGYSKFWISKNDTVYLYFVTNNTYTSYFGNVYDSIYLTAGTIYSLFLYNYSQYRTVVDRGIGVLENEQDSSGAWICKYWYLGQYYGTFLCTRVIASVKPEA